MKWLLTVIPVDEERLLHALDLPLADYEDAAQVACAERQGVDLIVTRNHDEFRRIDLEVLSPPELLARVAERR
jgi:predicted nucleic acid-binding protein